MGALRIDGKTISDHKDKANALNRHFFSEFTKVSITKQQTQFSTLPNYPVVIEVNITREGIKKLLLKLNTHKAPGADGPCPIV